MSEPLAIVAAAEAMLAPAAGPLAGGTCWYTRRPDALAADRPGARANVRQPLGSGRGRGSPLAAAAARGRCTVTLVHGPVEPTGTHLPRRRGGRRRDGARNAGGAPSARLPADVAIFAAAVADWRPATEATAKIKKDGSGADAAARARRESGHPDRRSHTGPRGGRASSSASAAETNDLPRMPRGKARAKWAPT